MTTFATARQTQPAATPYTAELSGATKRLDSGEHDECCLTVTQYWDTRSHRHREQSFRHEHPEPFGSVDRVGSVYGRIIAVHHSLHRSGIRFKSGPMAFACSFRSAWLVYLLGRRHFCAAFHSDAWRCCTAPSRLRGIVSELPREPLEVEIATFTDSNVKQTSLRRANML